MQDVDETEFEEVEVWCPYCGEHFTAEVLKGDRWIEVHCPRCRRMVEKLRAKDDNVIHGVRAAGDEREHEELCQPADGPGGDDGGL